mmetsp:Transcript_16812/g.35672  ORF Transcript_16812/g.35672 Transcript_16812/m.35672 type:complete len:362 (+) Transcript_16812:1428-2513(+)
MTSMRSQTCIDNRLRRFLYDFTPLHPLLARPPPLLQLPPPPPPPPPPPAPSLSPAGPCIASLSICTRSSFSTAEAIFAAPQPHTSASRFSSRTGSARSSCTECVGIGSCAPFSPACCCCPACPACRAPGCASFAECRPAVAGGRPMSLTSSATFARGSLVPPLSMAALMKTSPMRATASARSKRSASPTEWSWNSLYMAASSVRSTSTTETCHMASKKRGRLSCVACRAFALRPLSGSVSVAPPSSRCFSSRTSLYVRTAAPTARKPAPAAAVWLSKDSFLLLSAATWPSTPSKERLYPRYSAAVPLYTSATTRRRQSPNETDARSAASVAMVLTNCSLSPRTKVATRSAIASAHCTSRFV